MEYVYHGSPISGLTYIEPKISTHGKNWVYATKDKGVALVFLQKWNDFIFNETINNGRHELTERLPNMFTEIYKGKSGYLYHLDAANFLEGQTSFTPEVVSNQREKVVYCEVITDCYENLCEMEKNNQITLFRYPDRSFHIPPDDSDLIESAKYLIENSQNKQVTADNIIRSNPLIKDAVLSLL
jgi:hypothetical protein